MNKQRKVLITTTYNEMGIIIDVKAEEVAQPECPEQPESAKEYCAECDHIEMCRWYPYEGCEFRSLPSAERRGRWIETGMLYRDTRSINSLFYGKRCSVCNEISDYKPHYCPNCGAKMEASE